MQGAKQGIHHLSGAATTEGLQSQAGGASVADRAAPACSDSKVSLTQSSLTQGNDTPPNAGITNKTTILI